MKNKNKVLSGEIAGEAAAGWLWVNCERYGEAVIGWLCWELWCYLCSWKLTASYSWDIILILKLIKFMGLTKSKAILLTNYEL